MDQSYQKHTGKGLIVLSVVAALLAATDYLNIADAPFSLGANSWMLVAIALGIYGLVVNQWKSQKGTSQN